MKRKLKTVSTAIPKKQFRQILDYIDSNKDNGNPEPTVATFLRKAISDYLDKQGYEEVNANFVYRRGRPARKR